MKDETNHLKKVNDLCHDMGRNDCVMSPKNVHAFIEGHDIHCFKSLYKITHTFKLEETWKNNYSNT